MSEGPDHPGHAKHCRICGKDLSRLRRIKDARGRYRCPTCHDEVAASTQQVQAGPQGEAGHAMDETHASTDAIAERDGEAAPGHAAIDPALAETRVDEEALREPEPPALPVRPAAPVMRLAGDDEPGYTGTLGPRRRVQLTGGDDEDPPWAGQPTPAPVVEQGPALELDEIPEDRSDLLMRIKPGHLQLPLGLCVLGVLGAAALAFSLSAAPNHTMRAVNAAINSSSSAAIQAVAAVGVYALCCGIWLRPRIPWPIASVRLAAYSSLMACAAIALTRVPVAGITLMWGVPLISIVFVLAYLVRLRWIDAIGCGFLIHAAQLGVRIALDADLWAK